ncbi:hypothetical protein B0H66DRAFT_537386 [Apodospora peruviana]|uniref:Uncharacterized protein n=1 Tax=Apodospora peruviana TaxID=516989 RepID=A0AAE0HWC6_9PEZI|nr:hypothetical protein B0H66DRAFT_537386 [Apodospora peruviana]
MADTFQLEEILQSQRAQPKARQPGIDYPQGQNPVDDQELDVLLAKDGFTATAQIHFHHDTITLRGISRFEVMTLLLGYHGKPSRNDDLSSVPLRFVTEELDFESDTEAAQFILYHAGGDVLVEKDDGVIGITMRKAIMIPRTTQTPPSLISDAQSETLAAGATASKVSGRRRIRPVQINKEDLINTEMMGNLEKNTHIVQAKEDLVNENAEMIRNEPNKKAGAGKF